MKSFQNKLLAIVLLLGVVSCSEDQLRIKDAAQQRDAKESLNDPYLLSSVITKTALFYQDRGWGDSKLPGAVQYTMRNYQGGDNYYSGFKTPSDDLYAAGDILKLVDGAIGLSKGRGSDTHVGIFSTFRVLLFSFMTDYYGDIPYSEALKGRDGILYPKYDKQEDIYTGLLSELDAANALIKSGTDEVNATYDLMFGGDKLQWEKFNNSLKLRLLMHGSAKISGVGAKIAAVAALPLLTDAGDLNAAIDYVGSNSANSWVGGGANWGNGGDFEKRRPCKTFADRLATLSDPRMYIWFAPIENPWTTDPSLDGVSFDTTDPNGYTYTSTWEYVDLGTPSNNSPEIVAQISNILDTDKAYAGFIAGMNGDFKNGNGHYNTAAGGAYGNFKVSKYSKLFQENSHPLLKAQIMNKDEIQFLLAEARVKGFISTGTVKGYYEQGIKYSMERWGIDAGDVAPYLAQSSVALSGTGDEAKIAEQKWIALYSVAVESYLELRRTRLPNIFNEGNMATFEFPVRYRYPSAELGINIQSYNAGIATLAPANQDTQYAKIWLLQ